MLVFSFQQLVIALGLFRIRQECDCCRIRVDRCSTSDLVAEFGRFVAVFWKWLQYPLTWLQNVKKPPNAVRFSRFAGFVSDHFHCQLNRYATRQLKLNH